MDLSATIAEIASLPVDDRIHLVEAIWETIIAEPGEPPLSETQRQELERRLAAHSVEPENVVSWELVKAQALARTQQ